MSRSAHTLKFGFEFLHVQTKINDLNATIGRMNFEDRFTGRAVGDLLVGLPSQLALTSYTVMDQGQDMQFYYLQDDWRVTPRLTLNLGLRYEFATPPREKDNALANFDPATGTMVFAKDGSLYDRALIHPDRNNFAPRGGFAYSPRDRWVMRGAYGIFYSHTVRQGREGMLGFNPPYLVDNLLQTSVSGAAAVASAAPFQLSKGYPSGLLDPTTLAPTVTRRAQDPNQKTATIHQYNLGVQHELTPDLMIDVAYVGNAGRNLPGFRNLNQRAVIQNANGSQAAGARPYPAFGDIQWMENRVASDYNSLQVSAEKRMSRGLTALVSYTWGKALTDAPDHISTSGGGAGIDTGTFREPQDGNNLAAERGPAEFDIAHRFVASYVWELPFGRGRRFGKDLNRAADFVLGGWQLSGIHVVQSGLALTATLGGSTVLNLGGERRARPNLVGDPELPSSRAHDRSLVQHRRLRRVQSVAAGVRQRRRRHHARPRLRQLRLHAREGLPRRRPPALPVPHRSVQRLQPHEPGGAEHPARVERLRPDPQRRQRAHRPVRVEVLLLIRGASPPDSPTRRSLALRPLRSVARSLSLARGLPTLAA